MSKRYTIKAMVKGCVILQPHIALREHGNSLLHTKGTFKYHVKKKARWGKPNDYRPCGIFIKQGEHHNFYYKMVHFEMCLNKLKSVYQNEKKILHYC